MQGLETTLGSVAVCSQVIASLEVDAERCLQAFTPELFATDQVLQLVQKGTPFRDAYQSVAAHPEKFSHMDPKANIASKTHQGATGNLGLELSQKRLKTYQEWYAEKLNDWKKRCHRLIHQ